MPFKPDARVNAAYDKDFASSVAHKLPSCKRHPVPMRRAAEKASLSIIATVVGTDDDVYDWPSTPGGDVDGDAYCLPSTPGGEVDGDAHCLPSGPGSEDDPYVVTDSDPDESDSDDSDDDDTGTVDTGTVDNCADDTGTGTEVGFVSMEPTSSAGSAPVEGKSQIAGVEYQDYGDGSYCISKGDVTFIHPAPDDDSDDDEESSSGSSSDTGASAMEVEPTSSENANFAAIGETIDSHFRVREEVNAFAKKARGGRTNPGKGVEHLNRQILRTNILEGGTDTDWIDIAFVGNQSSLQHRNKRSPSPTRGGPVAGKGERRSSRRGRGQNRRYQDYQL